jgi:hypothetical protein
MAMLPQVEIARVWACMCLLLMSCCFVYHFVALFRCGAERVKQIDPPLSQYLEALIASTAFCKPFIVFSHP